jgi:uncharacterized membrane protein (UPF0127 family)
MSKKYLLVIFLFLAIGAYTLSDRFNMNSNLKSFDNLADREQVEIQVGDQVMNVEVVNSPQSTSKGLSDRDSIGSAGMLFIFPNYDRRYFWMKGMKFDIDIIWIADNKVVEVISAVPKPEPDTPDNRLETYSSQTEVNMVLELNAFDAQKFNINPGDVVQIVQ